MALAVTDRLEASLDSTVGRSQSAASMLSALDQFLDAPGDARSVAVHLTASGRRAARRVREQRLILLEKLPSSLDDDERAAFASLAGRLLVAMMRESGAVRWTCRLCDLDACRRREGLCPLEQEARRHYG